MGLLLGLAACGGKNQDDEATDDLAAIRARRDSARMIATQDSIMRVRYTTCADSVQAALAKAAHGKKPKAGTPAGMIPPEVLQSCGKPPTAMPTVATAETGQHTMTGKADTLAKTAMAKTDTAMKKTGTALASATSAVTAKQDTPRVEAPTKPALTPKQLQVMRADSIRLAKERGKQDSLRVIADRARQDS
ncbi:MAG: hypothetical protein ABI655_14175, partial [Phenylobacterium sp.]